MMELLADVTLGRPLPTSNDEYQPLGMQVTNLHEEMSKERQCGCYPTSSPYADAGSVVLLGMSHVRSHPCGCRGDRFEHGAPFSSPVSKQTGLQFPVACSR